MIFAYTSTSMAAPYIFSDLGGNRMTQAYPIILFVIGNVAGLPLARTFGGFLGKKTASIMLIILFILSTYALALSPNYPIFLIIRCIQGFFSGPLYIFLPSLGTDLSQKAQRGAYIQNVAVIFVVVSTLAICGGGMIAYFLIGVTFLLWKAQYNRSQLFS